jgi:hypothetical protein
VATYEDRAKLLWSLSGSGLGTTITGAGNSGGFTDVPPAPFPSSPIGLGPASDFQLMVYVTGKTSTPTFAVQLAYYDSLGNLFTPASLLLPIPVTAVPGTPAQVTLNTGVRAGGGTSVYFVFPQYGQISWTCTAGTVSGVEIELWGR